VGFVNILPTKGETAMYVQSMKEMIEEMVNVHGASETEVHQALAIWKLLEPCLTIDRHGRVLTEGGSKTPLGLLRSIVRVLEENE
jgi:hypothetical protein